MERCDSFNLFLPSFLIPCVFTQVFVTAGLGGMSGAQAKAAVICGAIGVVAEIARMKSRYFDHLESEKLAHAFSQLPPLKSVTSKAG